MVESLLSSQIKRTGNILRKGASDQIVEYNRRFESIKDLYDSFLVDLFVSDFSNERAYDTATRFFGSDKVEFAAVDGTEVISYITARTIENSISAKTGKLSIEEAYPQS